MRFSIPVAFMNPLELPAIARAAEEAGIHALAISDHVVHPADIASKYPYTSDGARHWDAMTPWPDPWVTIGALAAITTRLRFFTNVFILPARNPFIVAKAVGTAAVLSGDRMALGIGVGWIAVIHSTAELREMIAELHRMRAEYGRSDRPFEVIGTATDAFDVDGYRRLEDIGVTGVFTLPWRLYGTERGSLADRVDSVRRFGDKVISRMPRA